MVLINANSIIYLNVEHIYSFFVVVVNDQVLRIQPFFVQIQIPLFNVMWVYCAKLYMYIYCRYVTAVGAGVLFRGLKSFCKEFQVTQSNTSDPDPAKWCGFLRN
jgi:hypothetical protein